MTDRDLLASSALMDGTAQGAIVPSPVTLFAAPRPVINKPKARGAHNGPAAASDLSAVRHCIRRCPGRFQ